LVHAKGLARTLHIPGQEVLVVGDDVDLRRLFMIPLDNAIKYTEAGSIRLTIVASAQTVAVIVQDEGIGIAPSELPYVFDRFWRADEVRSRAAGGTGLGLSLAQQIVQRCGGLVSVESELGQGSAFTERLKQV
jgi:signal transduction histidine kinase